jgi:hypothetical protein
METSYSLDFDWALKRFQIAGEFKVQSTASLIAQKILQLLKTVLDGAEAAIKAVTDVIQEGVNGVVSGVENVLKTIKAFCDHLGDPIKGECRKILNRSLSPLQNGVNWVKNQLNNMIDGLANIPKQILAGLGIDIDVLLQHTGPDSDFAALMQGFFRLTHLKFELGYDASQAGSFSANAALDLKVVVMGQTIDFPKFELDFSVGGGGRRLLASNNDKLEYLVTKIWDGGFTKVLDLAEKVSTAANKAFDDAKAAVMGEVNKIGDFLQKLRDCLEIEAAPATSCPNHYKLEWLAGVIPNCVRHSHTLTYNKYRECCHGQSESGGGWSMIKPAIGAWYCEKIHKRHANSNTEHYDCRCKRTKRGQRRRSWSPWKPASIWDCDGCPRGWHTNHGKTCNDGDRCWRCDRCSRKKWHQDIFGSPICPGGYGHHDTSKQIHEKGVCYGKEHKDWHNCRPYPVHGSTCPNGYNYDGGLHKGNDHKEKCWRSHAAGCPSDKKVQIGVLCFKECSLSEELTYVNTFEA